MRFKSLCFQTIVRVSKTSWIDMSLIRTQVVDLYGTCVTSPGKSRCL